MITCDNPHQCNHNGDAKLNKSETGFTLLELLLVLTIMTVVASVTYPNLNKVLDSLRLRHDALQLAQELRACRSEAILSQESRQVQFYYHSNSYRLPEQNRVIYLSQGIRIEGSTFATDPHLAVPYCRFRATGAPSKGGHVKLVNRQGKAKYVIVSVAMGRVRVSDYAPGSQEVSR